MKLFLTGTDTNVGKTYVAALLIGALRRAGHDAVGFKPLCCGGREDAEMLWRASGKSIPLNDVNPVWLRTPAAPYAAAMIEERTIDLTLVRETFARLHAQRSSLIVEGVGGWRAPIMRDYDVGDLAAEFALPVAIVAANRLGALNHTLLTLDSIRARGLECAGIILNQAAPICEEDQIATATNRAILESLVEEVPILYEIAHGQREMLRSSW